MQPSLVMCRPNAALARFISHYWLSMNNTCPAQTILPDGCVDLVIEATGVSAQSWVYGTTTGPVSVPIRLGAHYLGIQFKPGQSRHFVALPAKELTDSHAPAPEVLHFALDGIAEQISRGTVFQALDRVLTRTLACRSPQVHRIDAALQYFVSSQQPVRIGDLAKNIGISRRHFERIFLDCVGVSPKMFATIQRYRAAAHALSHRTGASLADVAAAMGYADQSHMTRDFMRLTGAGPTRFLRSDVAFVQDLWASEVETRNLDSLHAGVFP